MYAEITSNVYESDLSGLWLSKYESEREKVIHLGSISKTQGYKKLTHVIMGK